MASEMPVLPEVGSKIVEPGRSRPSFSACSIMKKAARSFTDPVGFRSSSLAHRRTSSEGDSRGSPTSGVLPNDARSDSKRIQPVPFRQKVLVAAGYRGQDGDGVAVRDGGLQAAEEPDVLVVLVDVDEPAQLLAVEQPVANARVGGVQVLDQLAKGGTGPLNHLRSAGVGA